MKGLTDLPKGAAIFHKLPIGAGGFVTGMSISADGATRVVRCDSHGAYVWGASDTRWRLMLTAASIPAGLIHDDHVADFTYTDNFGCAEAVVAPSDATMILMTYDGYVLKSNDTGRNFDNTGAPRKTLKAESSEVRFWGKTLAIDHNDTSNILYGTQGQSVLYSTDEADSFDDLSVAAGDQYFGAETPHLVDIDPTDSLHCVYSVYGTGIFESTAGVAGPYTLMSGSPAHPMRMHFDAFGRLWATDYGYVDNVFKWTSGGAWVNVPTATGYASFIDVAPDPSNANHILVIMNQGFVLKSTDGGETWPYVFNPYIARNPPYQQFRARSIRYLDVDPAIKFVMYTGQIEFDPVVANKIWCPNGLGVSSAIVPATDALPLTWTEDSAGIEQLVMACGVVPLGGVPILGAWDQAIFRIESLTRPINPQKSPYLVTDALSNADNSIPLKHPAMIQPCAQLAVAADDPAWIACLNHGGPVFQWIGAPHNGFSPDGGDHWNMWPTLPNNKPYTVGGGSMAVGNAGDVVIIWNADAVPEGTEDGGNRWDDLPIAGLPASGEMGFEYQGAGGFFLNKNLVTYDAVGGYFYLYNYGPAAVPSLHGVWKSPRPLGPWTKVFSGAVTPTDAFSLHMRAVPGTAGDLFLTAGNGTTTEALQRTIDGAVHWNACTTNSGQAIIGVTDIGFGKAAPGRTNPAFYFWGKVGSQWGAWRSDDNLVTSVLLAAHPGGYLDEIAGVVGDPNIYGRAYWLLSGSGALYCDYDFAVNAAA